MKLAKMRAAAAFVLPHWVTVLAVSLLVTFGSAAEQYLQTVPAAQWLAGLSNLKSLIPVARTAFAMGLAAVVAQIALLIKQWLSTIVVTPTPTPPVPPPLPPSA
jgi:hypothetical protein